MAGVMGGALRINNDQDIIENAPDRGIFYYILTHRPSFGKGRGEAT